MNRSDFAVIDGALGEMLGCVDRGEVALPRPFSDALRAIRRVVHRNAFMSERVDVAEYLTRMKGGNNGDEC